MARHWEYISAEVVCGGQDNSEIAYMKQKRNQSILIKY